MPRRRCVRIRCHAPDGRPYVIEQDARRARAQLRVWLATTKRYQRMTIPFNLLTPGDTSAQRAAAVQFANERIMKDPVFNPMSHGGAPTLGEVLAIACAPETTRQREASSDQDADWKRASREVLAVLPADLPLADLSGQHVVTVAKSAMLRRACGASVEHWLPAVRTQVLPARRHDALHLDDAVRRAYEHSKPGAHEQVRRITFVWPRRVIELLRAMIRHVAKRHIRFHAFRLFSPPSDFMDDVRALATKEGVAFSAKPFRPTRAADEARDLMRELSDPRYAMRDLLAGFAGSSAATRLRASDVRVTHVGGVEVYCQRREKFAHREAWHLCDGEVSAALRALLTGPYAALEAARAAGGPDYRLVSDLRWTGTELHPIRSVEEPVNPQADALLDPRTWLLLTLGVEGRLGQVLRAMRSNVLVEGSCGELLLDVPDTDKKRATCMLLAPAQRAALAFAMRLGHLADLERAYRNNEISDYALCPSGELRSGRAQVKSAAESLDESKLKDWARDVERRLGIARVHGEGMYGWRRAFINLFDAWPVSGRVKDLITGHTDLKDPTYGSTRVTVYLDPRDLVFLREAQRLLEHVRTEYVRSGRPPAPVGTGAPPSGRSPSDA